MDRRFRGGIRGLLILLALTGCGQKTDTPPDADKPLHLRIEDVAAPGVFEREGVATRDRAKGAAGLWATVRGLPRPERAEIVNVATGATVDVALFTTRSGPDIRLSNEAVDALGITDDKTRVRVTVLRSKPVIDTGKRTTKSRF